MEKRKESAHLVAPKKGYLRYAVGFMLLGGILLNYVIKIMLSVAIVAMVKHQGSTSNATNSTDDNTCPGDVEDDSEDTQDGPFDWDDEVQGEILSAYFYGYIATQFLGGWAADRFGARWVFGPGLFVSGVFSLLSPEAAKFDRYAFMVVRAFQGVGSGVLLPSANILIARWFTLEERPQVAGVVLSATFGGTLISMLLSGVLINALGWSSVFYVFGTVCMLFLVPYYFLVYNSPEEHPWITDWELEHVKRGRTAAKETSSTEKQQLEQGPLPTPWLSILTSAQLWMVVSINCATAWTNYTMMTQLPMYISNILHFSLQKSGFVSSLPFLFGWISAGLSGTLSSWLKSTGRLSPINVYRIFNGIGTLGPAIFLVAVVLLGCDTIPIICCFVATSVCMCAFYGGSITQHLELGPNFAGVTTGILYTATNLPGILTPQATGLILKAQPGGSGWHIVFYLATAVSIAPYIFYLLFSTNEEQSWNRPKIAKKETDAQCVP